MNPAALKTNIGDLPAGGALIVNSDAFTANNLKKAGYESNPLEDGSLKQYNVFEVPISTLNARALEGLEMTAKQVDLTKNFFALGLMFWLYERSMEPDAALDRAALRRQAGDRRGQPARAQGRLRLRRDHRDVPHDIPGRAGHGCRPGRYRNITGNEATALGFVTAARLAKRDLVYGSYPITPASDILHALAGYKNFGVKTFQAEDEIAAMGSAIGAAYGGALAPDGQLRPGHRAQERGA